MDMYGLTCSGEFPLGDIGNRSPLNFEKGFVLSCLRSYFQITRSAGVRTVTTIAFDTLAYANKLKQAGVPDRQAEVQAEAMAELVEERSATKRDLSELEERIANRMNELEYRLTVRLGSMLVVAVSILAALVKLL